MSRSRYSRWATYHIRYDAHATNLSSIPLVRNALSNLTAIFVRECDLALGSNGRLGSEYEWKRLIDMTDTLTVVLKIRGLSLCCLEPARVSRALHQFFRKDLFCNDVLVGDPPVASFALDWVAQDSHVQCLDYERG